MQFDQLKRREFITLLGGAAAWPLAARAAGERVRRIGVLVPYAESDLESRAEVAAFRESIQQLGWIDGRNVRIDVRWAGGEVGRIRTLAKELVAVEPDLILSRTTPVTAALVQETRTTPIVFVNVADPVGPGFVASMARPRGNVTGFTNLEPSLGGKYVELLRELSVKVDRIALIFNPKTAPYIEPYLVSADRAAASFKAVVVRAAVENSAEIEAAIEELSREPGGGLIAMPDATTTSHRALITSLAARHGLPAVYPFRFFSANGGLASYGPDTIDMYRRAAAYADRILRGEQPAELAVQAPTKFDLVVNLKAARALSLAVSPRLLALADELIE